MSTWRRRGWAGAGPAHPGAVRRPGGWRVLRRRVREPDRGGASIWVLATGLLLALAGAAGAAVGGAVIASHRAGAAADLGALAGAAAAVRGDPAACARAERIVRANEGRLVACRVDGLDVVVTVEVDVTGLRGLDRVATAVARAGPVRG